MIKKIMTLLAIPVLLSACSDSGLHVSKDVDATFTLVHIKAVTDSVTVNSVISDRGNCQAGPRLKQYALPTHLVFGQELIMVFYCDPIETTITTDSGEHTFYWNH